MKYRIIYFLLVCVLSISATAQTVQLDSLNIQNFPDVSFSTADYSHLADLSEGFQHLPKLVTINDSFPATESGTNSWPAGAWGQGSYSDYQLNNYTTRFAIGADPPDPSEIPAKYHAFYGTENSCHPSADLNSKMTRGHLLAYLLKNQSAACIMICLHRARSTPAGSIPER